MLVSQKKKKKIFHASYHKRHTAPFFTLPTLCFPEPSRQKSLAGSLARVNSCSFSTKSFERTKRKRGSSQMGKQRSAKDNRDTCDTNVSQAIVAEYNAAGSCKHNLSRHSGQSIDQIHDAGCATGACAAHPTQD